MKRPIFLIGILLTFISCNQPEPGAIDNDTMSHKLFDAIRDNNFEKTKILMPDKGTYRKIIRESEGIEISESKYDEMIAHADSAFAILYASIADWDGLKFQNAQSDLLKQGNLQFASNVVKAGSNSDVYKFSFTSCKYNSKWFYLGDVQSVNK